MARVKRGLDWLVPKQVLDVRGDWIARRPDLRPGGWAFQYANPHYPDVDDTAVVAMAMERMQHLVNVDYQSQIDRAREWIVGMQSANGAWGAFDADNEYFYLNNIPFADHGALLDPPTEDVSARCLSMLGQFGDTTSDTVKRGVDYLRRTQLADGSWYGRWGMNYIYGTWSVLCALNAVGVRPDAPEMRKAVDWLVAIQNPDGGWGEDGDSYKLDYRGYERAPSTASQTAWALLGLMAAGEVDHPAVARGAQISRRHARHRRLLERAALYRDRFPARVLSALPRLFEILPALGHGALPQSQARQRQARGVRDVISPIWRLYCRLAPRSNRCIAAALGYIRISAVGDANMSACRGSDGKAELEVRPRLASEESAMKLNTAQLERTVNQLQAQALPDNHPLIPQLNRLYGDHTYFLNGDGLNIVEPADKALELPTKQVSAIGVVFNVAYWTDSNPRKLEAHEPEITENTVSFATDGG